MKPILVYARDPGSANQMVAVCEILSRDGGHPHVAPLRRLFALDDAFAPSLRVYARGAAFAALDGAGFTPSAGGPPPEAVADSAGVLTGLDDVDDPTPRALWREARRNGRPSAAFCDNDVNLAERLRDGDAVVAPDLVFAISERGCREIAGCRIPGLDIRMIPDLHLARLARRPADPAARTRQRSLWGIPDDATVWLYAGVVRREFAGLRTVGPEDEVETLRDLLGAIARHGSSAAILVVRPHPRDPDGKYDVACREASVPARVSRAGSPADAFLAADFVVSLSEAVLNEARLLGRPADAPAAALARLEGRSP